MRFACLSELNDLIIYSHIFEVLIKAYRLSIMARLNVSKHRAIYVYVNKEYVIKKMVISTYNHATSIVKQQHHNKYHMKYTKIQRQVK